MGCFGRQVILQIGNEIGSGREFKGFRIRFRVEMTRKPEPNKATIEIYGVSAATIALVQAPESIVRLLVGYEVPMQIFRGNPIESEHDKDVGLLTIRAQDGQRQWARARVNLSFATDTTSAQVFAAVSAALGLPTGAIALPGDIRLSQGAVLSGSARDVLDSLCRSIGAEWFIRDGALQVTSVGGSTMEPAVVFSSLAGNLIGSPKRTKEGCEITGLISPTLRPGKLFSVVSEEVNGIYVADSLSFDGDSGWETPFYVTAKGTPYA